ncbi:HNH endonuclease [Brevundimonas sp.]|jgi:5-methylcytosine-specific restriction endonuclease McrA|uniref:HNH endonuclease n=1 Tax=Brevundimonas sp. TaxID=1871086 RepID=UPI003784D991
MRLTPEFLEELRVMLFKASHLLLDAHIHIRRKPMIGGVFGAAGFSLCSYNSTYTGLDVPTYLVMESSSGLMLAREGTKAEAIDLSRVVLQRIGPSVFAGWSAQFHAEVEANKAIAEAAKAKAWEERRAKFAAESATVAKKVPRRRAAVFAASNGKCHYCSTVLSLDGKWHIEHKMPRALLGGSEQSNLVAACVSCNMKKRDQTDLEFIASRGKPARPPLAEVSAPKPAQVCAVSNPTE